RRLRARARAARRHGRVHHRPPAAGYQGGTGRRCRAGSAVGTRAYGPTVHLHPGPVHGPRPTRHARPRCEHRHRAVLGLLGVTNDDEIAALYASLPRKRVAAGALFVDGAAGTERVLLVEPTYKDVWDI